MPEETFYIHHRHKDKHLYKTALPVTGEPYKRLRDEAKRLKETLMFKDWVGRRLYAVDAKTHQTLARCNVLRSEKQHEAGGKYRLKINVYLWVPMGCSGETARARAIKLPIPSQQSRKRCGNAWRRSLVRWLG